MTELFDGLHSPNVRVQWKHDGFHKLLHQATTNTDLKKQRSLLKDAMEYLVEDMPAVPISHSGAVWVTKDGVEGFAPHPSGKIRFNRVLLK